MSNSLVSGGPANVFTPPGGASLFEDCELVARAIEVGEWIEGGMEAFSALSDGVSFLANPVGELFSMGMGWLLDNVEPLKGWLNDLTGDAGEVKGFATTWANAAEQIHSSGDCLQGRLGDLQGISGAAFDDYMAHATASVKYLHGVGNMATAVSVGFELCSRLVQAVHDLVVDVLTQVAYAALEAAVTTAITVGFGAPAAAAQVAARAAALAARVSPAIMRLLRSIAAFIKRVARIASIVGLITEFIGTLLGSGDSKSPPTPPGNEDSPTPPGDEDSPTPPGDEDSPTPPGDEDSPTPPGNEDSPTPPGEVAPPPSLGGGGGTGFSGGGGGGGMAPPPLGGVAPPPLAGGGNVNISVAGVDDVDISVAAGGNGNVDISVVGGSDGDAPVAGVDGGDAPVVGGSDGDAPPVAGTDGGEKLTTDEYTSRVREWVRNPPNGYEPYGDLSSKEFFQEYFHGVDEGVPQWNWPDGSQGFNGPDVPNQLQVGDVIDSIGHKDFPDGDFASPVGTSFEARSLPPDRLGSDYVETRYEVVKPLPETVREGLAQPWFEQPGLGRRYYFPGGIEEAVRQGYLKPL